jgi:hypothetical protein
MSKFSKNRLLIAGFFSGATTISATTLAADRPPQDTPLWIDRAEAEPYRESLARAAIVSGVPIAILAEVIGLESGFRNVKNPTSSAYGFGQQINGNAIMHGCQLNRSIPADSILGAALQLRIEREKRGSWEKALDAYGTTAAMTGSRRMTILRRIQAASARSVS